ncbi:translation initiation factor IF-2-like [Pipra filicauda]|uniref:Translation initiation factor IF-2-like n=1 Tax=Pipra filicauda TaxID=649802 RepID=A0A7R5KIR0_9PASS|nr:translation initiation factor IF-2-like [Pipra filicauda]
MSGAVLAARGGWSARPGAATARAPRARAGAGPNPPNRPRTARTAPPPCGGAARAAGLAPPRGCPRPAQRPAPITQRFWDTPLLDFNICPAKKSFQLWNREG